METMAKAKKFYVYSQLFFVRRENKFLTCDIETRNSNHNAEKRQKKNKKL